MALYDDLMSPQGAGLFGLAGGLLEAGGPSRMPVSFGQALNRGGMQGFGMAQQAEKMKLLQSEEKRRQEYMKAQEEMLRSQMAEKLRLQLLRDSIGPRPVNLPQAALTEGASQGDIGPTVTNAARLDALQQNPPSPQIPMEEILRGYRGGLDIKPLLDFNKAAEPQVNFVDTGSSLTGVTKSGKPTGQTLPKTLAPQADPNSYREWQKAVEGGSKLSYEQWVKMKTPSTTVNAFEPATVAAQREYIKNVAGKHEQLSVAEATLQNIERAKELIPQAKGFMGPGGESLLEAAKFLNNRMGTQINLEGVKSAEELRSRIFMQIMDNLKKMDAQPSQMQQQIMMEALGKLGTDPNALPAVLDAFADVIENKVSQYNKDVKAAKAKGIQFPFDPEIKLTPRKKKEKTYPTPPQGAINHLKMSPNTAAQFDELFGPGAAARVLGQ